MISMICGPMYSSKSTSLMAKVERALYARKTIAFVRPKKDTRGYLVHNDTKAEKLLEKCYVYEIEEFTESLVMDLVSGFAVIAVDEYFMIKNCKLLCTTLTNNKHCDIYFAGLLATSENNLFSETIEILPYCDKIVKLNGICENCGSEHGNYSYYVAGEKNTDIVVGDNDYKCVCRKCYKKLSGKL